MVQDGLNTGGLERISVPVVKAGRGVKERECSRLNSDVCPLSPPPPKTVYQTGFIYVQSNEEVNNCQHGLVKNKYCQTSLISLYDKTVEPMNRNKAVAVIYFDFI